MRINHMNPNNYLSVIVFTLTLAKVNGNYEMSLKNDKLWTELDYHANMEVIGWHALIINSTGQMDEVRPFTPEYESL